MKFINLLNKLRNNQVDYDDLDTLHHYFKPGYTPEEEENYITLTSHNAKADSINQTELDKINAPLYAYEADIKGDFNENTNPADRVLYLKEGAQIMFTKNDKNEPRRFYNGKIGTISKISGSEIYVVFPHSTEVMLVDKETWKNIKYQYNTNTDSIDEEVLGTFSQYPIRLAWAITIHKSQGLTFEKAIIDAGASFAPGQVYVALSRLTSLDGLILYSKIQPGAISTDQRVVDYSETQLNEHQIEQILNEERDTYLKKSIIACFDFKKLHISLQEQYENYSGRSIPELNLAVKWCKTLLDNVKKMLEVSEKFEKQLLQIIQNNDSVALHDRANAASKYFLELVEKDLNSIKQHIADFEIKTKTKAYIREIKTLELLYRRKMAQLKQAVLLSEGISKGLETDKLLSIIENDKKNKVVHVIKESTSTTGKKSLGETKLISLKMYKEGKTIAEIATLRGMVEVTIEGHLLSLVPDGHITLEEIISPNKIKIITDTINELNADNSKAVKEKLGDNYSWNEIRAVLSIVKSKLASEI
jgi:hypothetical protein